LEQQQQIESLRIGHDLELAQQQADVDALRAELAMLRARMASLEQLLIRAAE
jgi:phage shock protein A